MQRAIFSTEFPVAAVPDLPRFAADRGGGLGAKDAFWVRGCLLVWTPPMGPALTSRGQCQYVFYTCLNAQRTSCSQAQQSVERTAAGTWPDQHWQSNFLSPDPVSQLLKAMIVQWSKALSKGSCPHPLPFSPWHGAFIKVYVWWLLCAAVHPAC